MQEEEVHFKLLPEEFPDGFVYPESFDEYLESRSSPAELEPWGIVADLEVDACDGEKVVQFAQAWHEDLIACFIVENKDDPRVVVLNPWANQFVDGNWKQICHVVERLPNFVAWLDWVRNSELVKNYSRS